MPQPALRVAGLSCALLALVAALSSPGTGEAPAPEPWRILVTNDDGIESRALAQLVAALAKDNEVVVCAPDGNRSCSSHSVVSWRDPMSVREVEVEGAALAVAVGGNPADAVGYGLVELGEERPFDLVVSGINDAANVGDLSHYSGTVGAAMDAAYRGVPAIAASQGARSGDFSFAADFTARFAAQMRERGTRPGLVYSINFPGASADQVKGVAIRPMGGSYLVMRGWLERETAEGEPGAMPRMEWSREAPPEGSDTEAYREGYVTITPLQFDWTDRAALEELEAWELAVE